MNNLVENMFLFENKKERSKRNCLAVHWIIHNFIDSQLTTCHFDILIGWQKFIHYGIRWESTNRKWVNMFNQCSRLHNMGWWIDIQKSGEINLKYHDDGYEEMIKVVYVRTNKNSLFFSYIYILLFTFKK